MALNNVLRESVIYQESDPYAVSDYIKKNIGNHMITIGKSEILKASVWHRDFSDVSLSRVTYGGQVRVQSTDLEDIYHLQIVTRGKCYWKLGDKDLITQAGEMLLLNPHDKVDLYYSKDCEKIIIKIPESIIYSSLADNAMLVPKGGVRFDHRVWKAADYKCLMYLLKLIFRESESSQSNFSELAPYGSLLAIKLLGCFSNNIQMSTDVKTHRCFLHIDNFITNNIKDDISVEQLAVLSKVSQRTLYNIFTRYKSVTPMHYIKQKKLLHVRKALQRKEGSCRNITEVALDFGFMHLGRFSSEYRKVFGELPSVTLRNRHN
ncbi:MAG: AraC family transcriptional regulator [Gammaproteobacteria bacterium]|jgi:AraC-like DNA-binding protein|nr:MAG: AraC family transcriptional regulator [Gammaproteobacteria bacterium]PHR83571.1 MAG: AraC family transcriptional regulator [Colwellia sp.]